MKQKSVYIAGLLAIIGAGVYFWQQRRVVPKPQRALPEKENERHHLTNAFSRAKELAVGN